MKKQDKKNFAIWLSNNLNASPKEIKKALFELESYEIKHIVSEFEDLESNGLEYEVTLEEFVNIVEEALENC